MIAKHFIIVIVGFMIISCNSKQATSDASDRVAGAYVREYSFMVTNPQSGKEIGIRTIKDTIFVQLVQEGYKISNRKWRLNDYDKEGWQNMEHAEDRPLPTYVANFVSDNNSLQSKPPGLLLSLYVDLSSQTISKSQHENQSYKKVK